MGQPGDYIVKPWSARTLLAAVTAVSLLALAPEMSHASSSAPATWTVVATPASDQVSLTGVACSSSASCLAVGSTFSGGSAVYAYRGGAWTAVNAPDPAGSEVNAVACPGSSYCIAVGSYPTATPNQQVTEAWKWNGLNWTQLSPFNPPTRYNELLDIRCLSEDDCEAVGEHDTPSADYPLAEYWNGASWTHQSTSGAPEGALTSVACLSAAKCEAVGSEFAQPYGTGAATLALGLNGSTWSVQPTPALPKLGDYPEFVLTGVACYTTGCLAVGNDSAYNTAQAVTEQWNGASWSLAAKVGAGDPTGAQFTMPMAVRCLSGSCTMVGDWTENGQMASDTLGESWNGSAWTIDITPNPGSSRSTYYGDYLSGLACTAAACFGVGVQQPNSDDPGNSLIEKS